MSLNVSLSFYFSSLKHNIIGIHKYTSYTSGIHKCRVYFHQATMGKLNQKIGKTVFEKVTQLVTRALVAIRKNKKLVKVKTQHWGVLIIWKRDSKIKAVKTGVTLKDLSLTISNLRTTAFCFENIKLLKIFLNNMSFVMAKK